MEDMNPKKEERKKKETPEPWSSTNVSTSLRNEFSSLARVVENSGSPDPLTLARYEAKIVESPPRDATAAPIYESNSVRGAFVQQEVIVRERFLKLRYRWSLLQLLFVPRSPH